MEWEGKHKPSSEKGVHAAAYELFDDVGFVIHTHQNCASAIGLAGFDSMDITSAEREALGGVAKAEYGLPGMKKLKNAVKSAMQTGAHTVFMVNHGVVVCGSDKKQAMERVQLLEDICRRNLHLGNAAPKRLSEKKATELISAVRQEIPTAELSGGDAAVMWSGKRKTLHAQLDDMAQMLGSHVPCVDTALMRFVYKKKYSKRKG